MRTVAYPTPTVNYLPIKIPQGGTLFLSMGYARRCGVDDLQGAAGLITVDHLGAITTVDLPYLATVEVEGRA
jgi:hypothetical protein